MSQVSNSNDRRTPLQLSLGGNKKSKNKSGLPVAVSASPGAAMNMVNFDQQQQYQQLLQAQMQQMPGEIIEIEDDLPLIGNKQGNNKNSPSVTRAVKNGSAGEESPRNVQNGSNNKNSPATENGSSKKATNGSHKAEEKIGSPLGKESPKLRESARKSDINKDIVSLSGDNSEQKSPAVSKSPAKKQESSPVVGEGITRNLLKTPEKVNASILNEKDLKGFDAEGFEMESILLDTNEYEDSPIPGKNFGSAGKNKNAKPGVGPSRARISPFRRSERLHNTSTIVNLSTVSEQSTEQMNMSNAEDSKTTTESLRFISGRKSTRPLKEISFTHRKTLNTSVDSNSSMNATLGSERNESFFTPIFGRKRKDPGDDIVAVDSPKRSRLDFSGLLGFVASPVTMLKNRFASVKIQTTSTPNKNEGAADANDDSVCEETPNAEDPPATIEDVPEESPAAAEGGSADEAAAAVVVEEGTAANEDDIEIKEISEGNRSRCNIM